jgi:hypothetical protein
MPSSLSTQGLSELQEKILRLAYERLLEKEDLSYGEIVVTLFGCKPERIGRRLVRKLPLNEIIAACRMEPDGDFCFSDRQEEDKYRVAQASVFRSVSRLVENGLLAIMRAERLIWSKDRPRVERIESCETIRLTEKGEKVVGKQADQRGQPRHSLRLAIEYYLADARIGNPGFTVDVSEGGLSLSLFKRLKVGQELNVKIFHPGQGCIEMAGRIVWVSPPPGKEETYRSGMRIVQLSSENKDRIRSLLANA